MAEGNELELELIQSHMAQKNGHELAEACAQKRGRFGSWCAWGWPLMCGSSWGDTTTTGGGGGRAPGEAPPGRAPPGCAPPGCAPPGCAPLWRWCGAGAAGRGATACTGSDGGDAPWAGVLGRFTSRTPSSVTFRDGRVPSRRSSRVSPSRTRKALAARQQSCSPRAYASSASIVHEESQSTHRVLGGDGAGAAARLDQLGQPLHRVVPRCEDHSPRSECGARSDRHRHPRGEVQKQLCVHEEDRRKRKR